MTVPRLVRQAIKSLARASDLLPNALDGGDLQEQ